MKTKKIVLLLLLLIAGMVSACSQPVKLPPLDREAVILAFGDSLTFGTGAEPSESYPAILEKMTGRRVINAGVPGEVTAAGLARLPEILERDKPALMILCEGGNDQLRRQDPGQTAENIRAMINTARERNIAVVLIAVPAPGLSLSPPPLYKNIASQMSVPVEEKVLRDILADHSLKSDLIHPNAAGYRKMAQSVDNLLRRSGAID